MNELTRSWDGSELDVVGNELERLFLAQDRPLPKEKKILFLDELSRSRFPASSIMNGMRSLMTDDDGTKLKLLDDPRRSARSNGDPAGIYEILPCEHCDKRGLVMMIDDGGYWFALACRCGNGRRWVDQGCQRWVGGLSQVSSRRNVMTDAVETRTLRLLEWPPQ